jgi:hypothetical protein
MKYEDGYEKYEDGYEKYDEYMDNEKGYEGEEYGKYEEDHKEKPKKMVEVDEVLGIGDEETVVEVCIPLCPPAFEIEEKLITKRLVFDALIAGKDKVFVNGRLIKDVPYKTREEVKHPGCERISKLTFGNVKHATAEIPFALCIKVPGSEKGAKVVVLKSEVSSVEIPNILGCTPHSCVGRCEPPFLREDTCERRLIRSITEKDCIFVKVKVVKPTIITLPHKPYEEC